MRRRLVTILVSLLFPFWLTPMAEAAENDVVGTVPVGASPIGICSDSSSVYAANLSSNTVTQVNASALTVTRTLTGFSMPRDCVVNDGKLYVVNQGVDNVSVVDLANGTLLTTISVGMQPLSVTKYGGNLYVANLSGDSISVINIASSTVTSTINLAPNSGPADIAISGSNLIVALYESSGSGGFSVIDATTNSVSRTVPGSRALKVAVGNGLIVLASPSSNSVIAYSSATFTQVWVVGSLNLVGDVILVGDTFYASERTANQVVQIHNGSTIATVSVAGDPWGLSLVGNRLFVTANSADAVAAIEVDAASSNPASGPDAPRPVLQQVGLTPGASCNALDDGSLNWGGSSSGGWGQSWAQWANAGLGGVVCTRTLRYYDTLGHWAADA